MGRLEDQGVTPQMSSECKGKLVAVEGIDASGKTSIARLLASHLREKLGTPVALTREPTDGPVGRLIRSLLHSQAMLDPWMMALLYAADRRWHLYEKRWEELDCTGVVGCLRAGAVVVTDRYYYSSLAYQTAGVYERSPPPLEWVAQVNGFAPAPHVLVYVDSPVEEAARRLAGRGSRSFFEREYRRLEALRESFERVLSRLGEIEALKGGSPECRTVRVPHVVKVVNSGGRPLEDVALEALEGVLSRLG